MIQYHAQKIHLIILPPNSSSSNIQQTWIGAQIELSTQIDADEMGCGLFAVCNNIRPETKDERKGLCCSLDICLKKQ